MSEIPRIVILVQILILLTIIILTWIYALPIIFIRRFHTTNNILTCNLCLLSFLCSLHWTIHYIIHVFYPNVFDECTVQCTVIPYFQTMVNCLVIYALIMITINRFFLITYPNKRLLERHTWSFISLITQWIVSIILPLPFFTLSFKTCTNINMIPLWLRIYNLFIMVILPSILHGLFNLLILFKVKSSTHHLTQGIIANSTTNSNKKSINARDTTLLKHMLFIHIVFVIGLAPNSILSIISLYTNIPFQIHLFFQPLPALSFLIVIFDLYLYNHEVRQYLTDQILSIFMSKSIK